MELLGGDAGVVVIDGRAVVADELAALRDQVRQRLGEEPVADDGYRAALLALGEVTAAAGEAFAAEWYHERGALRPAHQPRDGGPVTAWEFGPDTYTHRTTGEQLGAFDYFAREDLAVRAAWVAALPGLEEAHGLPPGAMGHGPVQRKKPDPWPGDPSPPEGGWEHPSEQAGNRPWAV